MNRVAFILLVGAVCAMAATTKPEHEEKKLTASGSCPEFPGMATLDASKSGGDWIVVKYAKVGIEKGTDTKTCIKKTLKPTPDNGVTGTMSYIKNGKPDSHSFTSTPVSGKPGHFTVTSPDHPGKTAFGTILDTDYTNYSVGVLCKEEGGKHGYIVEVTSREKTIDAALHDKVKTALDSAKITAELLPVDQTC